MHRASHSISAAGWRIVTLGAALALLGVDCISGSRSIQSPSASGAMLYGSVMLPESVRDEFQWNIIYRVGVV